MPWAIRMLPGRPQFPQVGDAWFEPDWRELESMSVKYKKNWKHIRPPLVVCLPDTQLDYTRFCVDMPPTDDPEEKGWTVTGEAPNITVEPSIHCVGSYHGYIRNGIITDDIDKRKYPHAGKDNWVDK